VGRSVRHRGRANLRKQEEPAPGLSERTSRGSPRATASARERAWRVRGGRRSRPPSLRGLKSSGSLPAGRTQLQKSVGDVWSRISSANALQKERQGRVNGGLGRRARRRVILPPDASGERTIRESASPVKSRERTGEDPGWREIVIRRLSHRRKRWGGRGAGAVIATGSYEGPLPIEGTPDHHETPPFTGRRRRWSRRHARPPTRTTLPKGGGTARLQRPRRRARREGTKRGSRQECQRFDRRDAVGRTRPRPGSAHAGMGERARCDPPKRSSDVVKTSGPPVMLRGA